MAGIEPGEHGDPQKKTGKQLGDRQCRNSDLKSGWEHSGEFIFSSRSKFLRGRINGDISLGIKLLVSTISFPQPLTINTEPPMGNSTVLVLDA